jgi:hypothetical protein
MLYGCFLHPIIGPGYSVDMKVTDNETLKIKDVKFIEDIITNESFHERRVTGSDKRECIYYVKDKPQIQVGYCFDRYNTQFIKNVRVLISNHWKGQEPILKQEINRLSDLFYNELSGRFGKENIQIKRRRTGPPF